MQLRRVDRPPVDERVRALQISLNALGATLDPDGRFGRNTEAAVIAFARRIKAPDTGIVDDGLLAALQAAAPKPTPLPSQPYTTVGDSIVVGIDAQYRSKAFSRMPYHTRKDGKNPEMVGKTTRYIKQRLQSEVLPNVAKLKAVVIGGGANDLLRPTRDEADMEKLYREVTAHIAENIALAKAAGLRVVSLTLPPEAVFIERTFPNAAAKARAHRLNARVDAFIKSQTDADAVIDLTALIGDVQDGKASFKPEYRSKIDLLHPLPQASRVVARAIEADLVELESPPRR